MRVYYSVGDLPENASLESEPSIALDTEAMGLNNQRDRLCLVQIATSDGRVYLVHFPKRDYSCPRLKRLLSNPKIEKIFHFARFDLAILHIYLGIEMSSIYCTKTASKLCRTYSESHGLRDLCATLLSIKISKQQTLTDWGAETLTPEQIDYAATDVIHLHNLKKQLDIILTREYRAKLAYECFKFLPLRAKLDAEGWGDSLFMHH